MKPPVFIPVDEDIALRHTVPAYAAEIYGLVNENRAYLQTWLPWVAHTLSVQDTLAFIRGVSHYDIYAADFNLTIFYRQHIVGLLGFVRGKKKMRQLEIGYWLDEKHQGMGIMLRSVRSLIAFGFAHSDAQKIIIRADAHNLRSRAIPEALGFKKSKDEISHQPAGPTQILSCYYIKVSDHCIG